MEVISSFLIIIAGIIAFIRDKKDGRVRRLPIWVCVMVSSMPLLLPYLGLGLDQEFHNNRILGIEYSLKAEMFPVRLNSFTFGGYGYADAVFYPNLFLYIPAVLHGIGVPYATAVNTFLLLANMATAVSMYICGKGLFRSEKIAVVSSCSYTLSIYRLCNEFQRAAYGELLAMIFIPMVILGFYYVFFDEQKKWYVLVIGFTGVLQSHLVSSLLVAMICLVGGVFCIKYLVQEKRYLALLKALFFTLLLNVWELVPLIQYMSTEIDTSSLLVKASESAVPLTVLLDLYGEINSYPSFGYKNGGDMSHILCTSLGLSIVAGIIVFMVYKISDREEKETEQGKIASVMILCGVITSFIATDLFPWKILERVNLFGIVSGYIQFPSRFLTFSSCFFTLGIAYAFVYFIDSMQEKKLAYAILALIIILPAGYYVSQYEKTGAGVRTEEDVKVFIDNKEYLYADTDIQALNGEIVSPGIEVSNVEKKGLQISLTYDAQQANQQQLYIEVPLLYYPGYVAFNENGNQLHIERGDNNCIRVTEIQSQGSITVKYQESILWRVCEIISAVSLLFFGVLLFKKHGALPLVHR